MLEKKNEEWEDTWGNSQNSTILEGLWRHWQRAELEIRVNCRWFQGVSKFRVRISKHKIRDVREREGNIAFRCDAVRGCLVGRLGKEREREGTKTNDRRSSGSAARERTNEMQEGLE